MGTGGRCWDGYGNWVEMVPLGVPVLEQHFLRLNNLAKLVGVEPKDTLERTNELFMFTG